MKPRQGRSGMIGRRSEHRGMADAEPPRRGAGKGLPAVTLIMLATMLSLPASAADPLLIDDFASGRGRRWEKKIFKGETRYTPTLEDGRPALKAESRASASALIHR